MSDRVSPRRSRNNLQDEMSESQRSRVKLRAPLPVDRRWKRCVEAMGVALDDVHVRQQFGLIVRVLMLGTLD